MQTFYLDKSKDFGAEFGNSCYMVNWFTSSAFVLDDIFFFGICMCEKQSCEKIERLIWLILFAAKEKIFFFFWLVVGFCCILW